MEKTVAAVGFCCADVYEKLNKFYPTGNGIDWGVHLARMGVPVSVVSVVGTDSYGEKMKEALAAEHIDISHLRRRGRHLQDDDGFEKRHRPRASGRD